MTQLAGILPEFVAYLGIPITAALVGWGTNVLAVQMTFYPLEFVGIPPYLGWQGIIPNKSKSMAEKSVDMITQRLISIDEQFQNIDSQVIAQEMGPALERLSIKIVDEVMMAKVPLIWKSLPARTKNNIYAQSTENLPQIVVDLFDEMKERLDDLFDLKGMVVESLVNDKQLLNDIFMECGREEFKFVKKSGLYFGFLFGLVQMIVWYFFPVWWVLPFAGLLVGYVTNWIALKLIFEPLYPKKIGPYVLQGLFIKRQEEVAQGYSKLVKENIITSEKIFEQLWSGPKSPKLKEIIGEHVRDVVEETAQDYRKIIDLFYTPEKFETVKNIATYSFMEDFPILMHNIYQYTEQSLDVENALFQKMSTLPPEDFAGFLRPIFQEDEWKLIAVGAILGMIAGFMQLVFLF